MSAWRRTALDFLPEFRSFLESAENPMDMWIELHLQFDEAMSRGNLDAVAQILRFSAWCVSEQSGRLPNETSTAAAVAFYEHLPQKREYWQYFPKWFSRQEFERLVPVFCYHLTGAEVAELKSSYASIA